MTPVAMPGDQCLPTIDVELCTGCGDCVELCHAGALALMGGKAALESPWDCDYCAECEGICRQGAILCPFEVVVERGLLPKS
jgi:MinD superfamily P-loop ATPase